MIYMSVRFIGLLVEEVDLFVYSVLFQDIDVEPGDSVFHPDGMRKFVDVLDDLDRKSGLNAEHPLRKQNNAHRPDINDDLAERLT